MCSITKFTISLKKEVEILNYLVSINSTQAFILVVFNFSLSLLFGLGF